MIKPQICLTCKVEFLGGPNACYCHSCRSDRKRRKNADSKRNKRAGLSRPNGIIGKCERCAGQYTVKNGSQRFCPNCQPIHYAEHNRVKTLAFYHENKDRIKKSRNELRQKEMRTCKWCGSLFPNRLGGPTACSDDCRRQLINKYYRDRNKKLKSCQSCNKQFKPPRTNAIYCSDQCRFRIHKEKKRADRIASGLCPQCGKPWIEPNPTKRVKPKHCSACQEYYRNRYKKEQRP